MEFENSMIDSCRILIPRDKEQERAADQNKREEPSVQLSASVSEEHNSAFPLRKRICSQYGDMDQGTWKGSG